jgi:hypothetical protein
LAGLGGDDLVRLHPKLVRMTLGQLLHPVGARIEHVYFPESGMVSMLTVMKSGEQIETAIIGREGVIGGWVVIDGINTNTQSMVQVEGSAQQVSTAKFLETYRASDAFRSAMNAYQGVILFSGTTERRLSRHSFCRGAPLPLAPAFAGHTWVRARPSDPGISVTHAWRPKDIGLAVRTHFAEVRPNPIRPWQHQNPEPQGSGRMRLRMLFSHPRAHFRGWSGFPRGGPERPLIAKLYNSCDY